MSPTTSTPEPAAPVDPRVEVALAALAEVTDPADVGALVEVGEASPGVVDLSFACMLPGYPGWRWTVSTSALEGVEPTVLELELLPHDGSLLAPPWVPWAERLAEWRRTHADDAGAAEPGDEEEGVGDLDDEDDLDADDDLDVDELDGRELDVDDVDEPDGDELDEEVDGVAVEDAEERER